MMEAMMSMKKIMEANVVTIAATNVVAKVNPMSPSDLNQMNHPTSDMVGKDLGSTDGPMMCKFKTSTHSRHMACLPTIHHPMWRTLLMRMSITPLPYSLRADNIIMYMSLNPWGDTWNSPPQSSRLWALPQICHWRASSWWYTPAKHFGGPSVSPSTTTFAFHSR